MTGTPLDLTPFGAVLKGIGTLYWLFVLVLLTWVFWKAKGAIPKLLGCSAVLIIVVLPVALHLWGRIKQENEATAKLQVAMAHFEMRCKSAGEKISRTVKSVEGVVWMKWRPKEVNSEDQFQLNDPYGHDCYGDGCILRLLRASDGADQYPEAAKLHAGGYRFVETVDPRDGKRYRYTGGLKPLSANTKEEFKRHVESTGAGAEPGGSFLALRREQITQFTARYGITWEDLSTREDREKWIAGGMLRVIDLQTNEVIAERIGYLLDTGQGSTAGFRSPWGWAKSYAPRCPRIDEHTWDFSMRVLQTNKQGE